MVVLGIGSGKSVTAGGLLGSAVGVGFFGGLGRLGGGVRVFLWSAVAVLGRSAVAGFGRGLGRGVGIGGFGSV